jgi:uncharacterized spore protein YtfJ
MATQLDEAMDQARASAEGGPINAFLERFADRLGARATVAAVFGEPIERGDVTVIPVARVRWGVGGGAGSGPEPAQYGGTGAGGGGGVWADPVGYLEIRGDGAVFEPIRPDYPSALFLLVAGLSAAFVIRAFARLIRG